MAKHFELILDAVADKETLWREWACNHPKDVHRDAWRKAPTNIMSDPQLMLKAIPKSLHVMASLHSLLWENQEFLTSILERNIFALREVSAATLERLPSLIRIDLTLAFMEEEEDLDIGNGLNCAFLPDRYWQDRDFVLKVWLKNGGDLIENIWRHFADDEEVLLTHAKHYFEKWREGGHVESSYRYRPRALSERLKSDRDFFQKLLKLAPAYKLLEESTFRDDYELHLLACATSSSYEPFPAWDQWHKRRVFYETIRRQLGAYSAFFVGTLCGMSPDSGSPLRMLNQGSDANIKSTIASFCDFPTGESLQHLRKAAKHRNLSADNA
jgi:hypothetical protein